MPTSAMDFQTLRAAQVQEIGTAFRLQDKIQFFRPVPRQIDRPIRVIGAKRRVDLEAVREFEE